MNKFFRRLFGLHIHEPTLHGYWDSWMICKCGAKFHNGRLVK